MALKTKLFKQLPWIGGINTSLDPSVIPANQLVQADHALFGTRGSRKKRDGINFNWDTGTTNSVSLIGLHDFWYGTSTRTQRLVAVGNDKNIYAYSAGTQTQLTLDASATAWGSAISTACMTTLNNLCIIAVDGSSNVMRKWAGGANNVFNLGGTPPQASSICVHLGRLWTNDKTNLDRIQYSTTGNPEEWGGIGDSGALDIGIGDGDPGGVQALFSFKGVLFVAKTTKLYRILNYTPDTFQVELVSNGIGIVGPNAFCYMDQDDVFFISQKGVHSLQTTDQYGEFESTYVSFDIQKTFNEKWVKSRLGYAQMAYLPSLNSIACAVSDSDTNSQANDTIWLYNIPLKSWYRWPNISCQSLIVANDSDKLRFYIGTNVGRVGQAQTGTNYDTDTSGNQIAINFVIKTGIILPDDEFYLTKAFKKFALIYGPIGTHTITIQLQIDNYSAQSLAFSQIGSGAVLGTTFTLGTSVLNAQYVVGPYTLSIDGRGRGIQLTFTQSGIQEQVEIQGFALEYEPVGTQQETILSG